MEQNLSLTMPPGGADDYDDEAYGLDYHLDDEAMLTSPSFPGHTLPLSPRVLTKAVAADFELNVSSDDENVGPVATTVKKGKAAAVPRTRPPASREPGQKKARAPLRARSDAGDAAVRDHVNGRSSADAATAGAGEDASAADETTVGDSAVGDDAAAAAAGSGSSPTEKSARRRKPAAVPPSAKRARSSKKALPPEDDCADGGADDSSPATLKDKAPRVFSLRAKTSVDPIESPVVKDKISGFHLLEWSGGVSEPPLAWLRIVKDVADPDAARFYSAQLLVADVVGGGAGSNDFITVAKWGRIVNAGRSSSWGVTYESFPTLELARAEFNLLARRRMGVDFDSIAAGRGSDAQAALVRERARASAWDDEGGAGASGGGGEDGWMLDEAPPSHSVASAAYAAVPVVAAVLPSLAAQAAPPPRAAPDSESESERNSPAAVADSEAMRLGQKESVARARKAARRAKREAAAAAAAAADAETSSPPAAVVDEHAAVDAEADASPARPRSSPPPRRRAGGGGRLKRPRASVESDDELVGTTAPTPKPFAVRAPSPAGSQAKPRPHRTPSERLAFALAADLASDASAASFSALVARASTHERLVAPAAALLGELTGARLGTLASRGVFSQSAVALCDALTALESRARALLSDAPGALDAARTAAAAREAAGAALVTSLTLGVDAAASGAGGVISADVSSPQAVAAVARALTGLAHADVAAAAVLSAARAAPPVPNASSVSERVISASGARIELAPADVAQRIVSSLARAFRGTEYTLDDGNALDGTAPQTLEYVSSATAPALVGTLDVAPPSGTLEYVASDMAPPAGTLEYVASDTAPRVASCAPSDNESDVFVPAPTLAGLDVDDFFAPDSPLVPPPASSYRGADTAVVGAATPAPPPGLAPRRLAATVWAVRVPREAESFSLTASQLGATRLLWWASGAPPALASLLHGGLGAPPAARDALAAATLHGRALPALTALRFSASPSPSLAAQMRSLHVDGEALLVLAQVAPGRVEALDDNGDAPHVPRGRHSLRVGAEVAHGAEWKVGLSASGDGAGADDDVVPPTADFEVDASSGSAVVVKDAAQACVRFVVTVRRT